MINLQDIRYVRLGTRDLEGAIEFATKVIGLQLVAREGKSVYFRSDKVAVRGKPAPITNKDIDVSPHSALCGQSQFAASPALVKSGAPSRLL